MEIVHRKRTHCRACEGERLTPFLGLGMQPLANGFQSGPGEFESEARYPLDVYFCEDCSLVQLLDVIDPEVLFKEYLYVTGTSDTIARHNVEYARTVVDLLKIQRNDLVVEVASNNGSLLSEFQALGVRTLGVEPAANLAEVACEKGIETEARFFNSEVARDLRRTRGAAKAVVFNNVLAHVDDTIDFLGGARELIDPGGMVVFEVPYLVELLDRLEYDTIYHEHLCYFSVMSLQRLCEKAGLGMVRIERMPVHGGSLRVYASPKCGHGSDVCQMAEAERQAGLNSIAPYRKFAADVERNREDLRNLLCRLRSEGRSLAAYGAPAKGNTLLNYADIGTNLLPFTVDKNERKVGLYTPGMHIPVLPVPTLLERQPDAVLILAWNFAGEIITQQETYIKRGGRFITPVPQPVIH
jgi:C-methyltransferase C-terminal domain/Putative zinc binding domain/Methyltransferase domain